MEAFIEHSWLHSRASNKSSLVQMGLEYLGRGSGNFGDNQFNKTRAIIDNLVLDKVQQVRYMHIAFGCLSIVLAIWIMFRIWYDSWRASKLQVKLRPRKWAFLYDVHPAECFPLVLGFFILIQQLSFVLSQARALNDVFINDCRISSQVIFTQIFVLGYFHLVFGMEMTIRSFKRVRFAPRAKHTTTICVLTALALSILTWLSTRIHPPLHKCFGDMIWRSIKSSLLGIVICSILIPTLLAMAGIISYQLYRTVRVDQNERIAGTRMVYYLVLTAILYVMVLPFWIQAQAQTFDKSLTTSRLAEFILFISGAVIAFAHMFLRANAARTAIKPRETPWHERRRFRLCGPSDLELMNISAPIQTSPYNPDEKLADIWARQTVEKEQGMGIRPSASGIISPPTPPKAAMRSQWSLHDDPITTPKKLPARPPMSPKAAASPKTPTHRRNQPSYSLFPGSDDLRLPATVYSPQNQPFGPKAGSSAQTVGFSDSHPFSALSTPSAQDLQRPTAPWAPEHRRGSSASSATVQIGIRFSTAPAALAASGIRASPQAPQRPSLRAVIDSINPPQTRQLPTTSIPAQSRLDAPFDPQFEQQIPYPTSIPRRSDISQTSDYAWLDIAEAQDTRDATSKEDSQSRPRATAESNRNEIANLERSGSARSRQGYRPSGTPDGGSNGFF